MNKAIFACASAMILAGHMMTTSPATAQSVLRKASAESAQAPVMLEAETIAVYQAPEADQGVAIDSKHFYAIDNSVIGKYSLADGSVIARWDDGPTPHIEHLNSCYAEAQLLWCANSNYPAAPMGSSIEVFDTRTMEHHSTHSLGMMEEGSLTWFAPIANGFLAAFAHYDQRGVPYKDHRYSSIVTFDSEWRRTGGWLFPDSVIERMAPHASSGGAIGPDGRLYVSGHDRPEIYVLEAPSRGPYLVHIATITLEIAGQAFAFAPGTDPVIYAIDRREGLVRSIRLPRIASHTSVD